MKSIVCLVHYRIPRCSWMKHKVVPRKYNKVSLIYWLLAVPSQNSHVISHCKEYVYLLCATTFGER
jgi:hypothetical protein